MKMFYLRITEIVFSPIGVHHHEALPQQRLCALVIPVILMIFFCILYTYNSRFHRNLPEPQSDRIRRVSQGQELVPRGVRQGHQDRSDGAGAAEQAAAGARGVRVRHGRQRAAQHGLHGAAGDMGRRDSLPHLHGLH